MTSSMRSAMEEMMQSKRLRIYTPPAWLKLLPSVGNRLSFEPAPDLRRVFRRRKRMSPSDWAGRYRVMTYGPAAGAYWDRHFFPFLSGILDAAIYPSVRQIGNCKAPQTGSSASIETILGYLADYDPGDALIVYPDRETAAKRSGDYLQDVFRRSPRLKNLLTGNEDDMTRLRIRLINMLIYMGWAGSVTSLGNVSVRYLFLDEVDKYVESASDKEADPISLALERVRAYRLDSKVILISTPTTVAGPIYRFMQTANAVYDYHAQCPDCGHFQRMVMANIRWPHDDSGKSIDPITIKDQRLAYYVCEQCGVVWDDATRDKAVLAGEWHERQTGLPLREHLTQYNPERICFHTPAWLSRLVSLSECACAFLEAQKDVNKLKYFANQIAAEPWVIQSQRDIEDQDNPVFRLMDGRPRGMVPSGDRVACLLAGVDTQAVGYWYEIRAVGYGEEQDTWQVDAGYVETDEELIEALFGRQYSDADGKAYSVEAAAIDAMGSRTPQVYRLCMRHFGKLIPIQGANRDMASRYKAVQLDGRGGLTLHRINTNYYKNALYSRLQLQLGEPGAWMYHADTDIFWARQMVAEYVDEQGRWQCQPGRPNHAWDCSVYLLFLIDLKDVRRRRRPDALGQTSNRAVVRASYISGGR